jgi:hypothetical protein
MSYCDGLPLVAVQLKLLVVSCRAYTRYADGGAEAFLWGSYMQPVCCGVDRLCVVVWNAVVVVSAAYLRCGRGAGVHRCDWQRTISHSINIHTSMRTAAPNVSPSSGPYMQPVMVCCDVDGLVL